MSTPEKSDSTSERRSRIHGPSQQRESGDGMDAVDMAATEHKLSFGHLGLQAANLQPFYETEGKEELESTSEMYVIANG